uniref:Uncharacterized protein n=1 Tax=Nelumbo nucifera TaxID=4432 RepID=A0A822ZS53_NELNU|nr:TPA_asm: hypothetical protein HUJ06_018691 [Nelumbo nucifera]
MKRVMVEMVVIEAKEMNYKNPSEELQRYSIVHCVLCNGPYFSSLLI